MIKFFKMFESTLTKVKNPIIWKGKPYWIGIVDLMDGEIIMMYTYQKASNYDFHHSFYMDLEYQEKIKDGEYGIFWFNDFNDLDFWEHTGITSKVVDRIYQQVKTR